MSTCIYLTAEKKIDQEWKLFEPLRENQDWAGILSPSLIIDGGWPKLAESIINHNKNWSLPSDSSAEFQFLYNNQLKNDWSIGWGMYSELKNIEMQSGINDKIRLRLLFKNKSLNKENLRLIYWWS